MISSQQSGHRPAILLVSAAIIAYQLLLIQVLSLVQWYHFAYMIISVALLGFGASGTILSIFRRTILSRPGFFSVLFLSSSGLMMLISLRLTQSPHLAFDSYLLFHDSSHIFRLVLTYILFFLPFLCGALYIGLTFRFYPESIGRLYFFNLLGSAAGGLLVIFLLHYYQTQRAVAIVSLLPVLAALLIIPRRKKFLLTMPLIALMIAIIGFMRPPALYLSEYKSLSKTLNLPGTNIIAERTSPHGLIQAVASPYLRYAPGLSLKYQGDIPFEIVLFNNGEFIGPLYPFEPELSDHYYDHSTLALPFILTEGNRALILDAGSGDIVSYAAYREMERISAVDGNPAIFSFINDDLYTLNIGSSYLHPAVQQVAQDPFSYLLSADENYDLIHLPLTDAFGGSAGIYALQEKYLFTTGAFSEMWNILDKDGIITVSTWIDYPLRYPLKTLATLTELLEDKGITEPEDHLAAIRNWSMITFVLRKSRLSEQDKEIVRSFSEEQGFDILLLPGLLEEDRSRFHHLTDDSLFKLSDQILSPVREDLYRFYQFNIEPATEESPYFFQFLRIGMIPDLLNTFDRSTLPFLELGYLLVLITFIQIIILTAIFVILPLIFRRWEARNKLWTFFYFSLLGLGYMMLEIVLIQRFIFYLGTPLYSTAAVISAMLLFSGIGSNTSSYLEAKKKNFTPLILLIVLMIIIYALSLNTLLRSTLHLSIMLRAVLTVLFLAPVAFILGFPFPLGIKFLDRSAQQDSITWAWAINGSFSVVSTVLATIIAVEAGFFVVMIIAAVCYLFALLSHFFIRKRY